MLVFLAVQASGQEVTIRGTVFNMYRTHPLEAVSVVSVSGRGTITDANGNYSIRVNQNDSLSFSYLGRATQFFAVNEMNLTTGFDIALHVSATELSEVRVAPRNLWVPPSRGMAAGVAISLESFYKPELDAAHKRHCKSSSPPLADGAIIPHSGYN